MLLTFYTFINNYAWIFFVNNQTKLAIIAIVVVITLASIAVSQVNFDSEVSTTDNSKLQIVTSAGFLYEFSQNIGKEKIDATLLIPMGVNPHDWEPTIRDTERLETSDMIIINGLGYETWVSSLDLSNYQGILVDTSNGIPIENDEHAKEDDHDEHAKEDEHDEHDEHGVVSDPHIWLNPNLVKIQVKNIAERLSEIDPENSKSYNENALQYIEKLELLDLQIREELSSCSKKDFITFHNAFSYFSDEYGLTQHTITKGVHDHSATPTAKSIEDVIDLAKELNLSVIFAEDTSDIRISQVIADEIGADVLILSPVATEDVENKNYFERMQQNASNLKKALCN